MKKIIIAFVFGVFAILNIGFILNGNDEDKNHPCPYVQQMRDLGGCPFIKSENDEKSECPYLSGKKLECPFLKEGFVKSEKGDCPYSGKNGINNSKSNQKIKLLEIKIS